MASSQKSILWAVAIVEIVGITGCKADTQVAPAQPESAESSPLQAVAPADPLGVDDALSTTVDDGAAAVPEEGTGGVQEREPVVAAENVTRWHPTTPFRLWRGPTSDELIDGVEFGWVPLDVHEVEIRLDPPDHEASTIILHVRADPAILEAWSQEEKFALRRGEVRHMAIPWDPAVPIEVELHYSQRNAAPHMKVALEDLWQRGSPFAVSEPSPEEMQQYLDSIAKFDPVAAIIADLQRPEFAVLNNIYSFDLWSARQTRVDGSHAGFDHEDLEVLRRQDIDQGEAPKVKDRPTKLVGETVSEALASAAATCSTK